MRLSLFCILAWIWVLPIVSCSSPVHQKEQVADTIFFKAGQFGKNIPCKINPAMGYSLYIPTGFDGKQKLPVILCFDPEGNGLLPVEQYRDLAEKYGFMLVGSNNSKNFQSSDESEQVVLALIEEVYTRLPADPAQIYVMGFSGGARVASIIAGFRGGIRGMIGCGAGLANNGQPLRYRFDWTGLVGNADLNYQEMILLDDQLAQAGFNHQLYIFRGIHGWPPAAVMDLAFGWHFSKAMKNGLIPVNDTLEKYLAARKETLLQSGILQIVDKSNVEVQKKEFAKQDEYIKAFTNQDEKWWKKEVGRLKNPGISDSAVRLMNRRLLAWLGVMSYSQSARALMQKDKAAAGHAIAIYAIIEPGNPEVARMKEKLKDIP